MDHQLVQLLLQQYLYNPCSHHSLGNLHSLDNHHNEAHLLLVMVKVLVLLDQLVMVNLMV